MNVGSADLISKSGKVSDVARESIRMGISVVVGDVVADSCIQGCGDGRSALLRDGQDVWWHGCS